jgi:electron transfer flavoprotein beta subunit
MDPEEDYLTSEDHLYRVNPYDEAAMEMAADIKDLFEDVEILAVTLGPMVAEAEFIRCLALGADRVLRIDGNDRMDPWRKSHLLARAAKSVHPDIVLCGKESLDTRNGQVAALMAHHLDMSFVSAIDDLAWDRDGRVATVRRRAGRGTQEIIECGTPAVFSVDLMRREPRLPTYEAKKNARALPVEELFFEEEEVSPRVVFGETFPPRPRPKQVPPIDSGLGAYERIEQLLGGSRVQKKGIILEGEPESQVIGIISFLRENGFLKDQKGKE